MITQKINLNLIPGGVMPRVNVSQYDFGSRSLEITLYNGSTLFEIPEGSQVLIQGTKKDMRGFQYENLSYSGSVVTADITQQMTVFEDEVLVELVITRTLLGGKSEQLATANFVLNVEEAALKDDIVVSETDIPAIQTLPEAMEEIRQAVITTTANAELADGFAEDSEAFAKGTRDGVAVEGEDPAYHNNSLYYSQLSRTEAEKAVEFAGQSEASALRASSFASQASTSEQRASASQLAASSFAKDAEDYSVLSRSWAEGGTGTRQGEDTDNSEYWANRAHDSATAAASSETDAETAADTAQDILDEITELVEATTFVVDFTTGELLYSEGNYTFSINTTTGNLEWEVAV